MSEDERLARGVMAFSMWSVMAGHSTVQSLWPFDLNHPKYQSIYHLTHGHWLPAIWHCRPSAPLAVIVIRSCITAFTTVTKHATDQCLLLSLLSQSYTFHNNIYYSYKTCCFLSCDSQMMTKLTSHTHLAQHQTTCCRPVLSWYTVDHASMAVSHSSYIKHCTPMPDTEVTKGTVDHCSTDTELNTVSHTARPWSTDTLSSIMIYYK